jgi:hypothetical protein
MEITLTQGNLYKADVDTLTLFLFEDTQAEDATKSLKTALTTLTASGDFTGKANQTTPRNGSSWLAWGQPMPSRRK